MDGTQLKEVLARVIQLGASPETDNQYGWISTLVSAYLSDNSVATYDDLNDDQQCELLCEIKEAFAELSLPLPDYLQEANNAGDVKLVSTLPSNAATLPDGNGGVTDRVDSGALAGTTMKVESDEDVRKKLEVAKQFLKELDGKLSKYEALNLEAVLDTLEKYESLGSIDELEEVMEKAESMYEKLESARVDSAETTKLKNEAANAAAAQSVNKGEPMTAKVEYGVLTPDQVKALQEQLAQYQALGTVEEIEALVGKADDLLSDNVELSSKTESQRVELEKYESIGTTEEILDVVTKYAEIKQKSESERIAGELGIPVEKVLQTIDKMESISAAEELLKGLFAKSEAEKEAEAAEQKRKDEAAEAERLAAEAAAKNKNESGSADESATLVDNGSVPEKNRPKTESSPERLSALRKLCAKL